MPEYIDRELLLDYLQIVPIDLGYREIEDVESFVKELPAADVVEVVRCKDCINHRQSGLCDGWSRYGTITTPDDAYCSYGRKIDD